MLDHAPCKTCLKNELQYYIDILNRKEPGMDKLLKARRDALVEGRTVTIEIELPMILGVKGRAVYTFNPAEIFNERYKSEEIEG